jgi:hypothetical protein
MGKRGYSIYNTHIRPLRKLCLNISKTKKFISSSDSGFIQNLPFQYVYFVFIFISIHGSAKFVK